MSATRRCLRVSSISSSMTLVVVVAGRARFFARATSLHLHTGIRSQGPSFHLQTTLKCPVIASGGLLCDVKHPPVHLQGDEKGCRVGATTAASETTRKQLILIDQ